MENFDKLKEQLETGFEWPSVYLFKFIVPADNEKIALVENLFNAKEADINMRESKNGNYVSLSAKELMLSPDDVIARYKKAAEIEGIVSL